VSLLGGSRFQIGGPAGAFIVLIASIVERQGYEGLVVAIILAGLLMMLIGFLRLGTYIKFIPYPVTVGFTAGIATIIFASQLKDLLGLSLSHEPAALLPKIEALWQAQRSLDPVTCAVSLLSIGAILLLRSYRPHWPGLLMVVAAAAALCWALGLDVATVGSRFGAVPSGLPAPSLPTFSLERLQAVVPDAVAIALLGSIESLLSAVVADGMSGRRHRSNCELVAQGVANIASALFGGICVTGTIARTATNVRSGAHGPVSGMLHAAYLLLFMLVAAPLIALVPLAVLASVLAIVAWNMAEKHEFIGLVRASMGDRVVLLATFLLTVFVDLTTGIGVGVTLGALIFMHRMAHAVDIETHGHSTLDEPDEPRTVIDAALGAGRAGEVMVYRILGPFFFGATATAGSILDRIGEHPKLFVLDFAAVPFVDSTGATTLEAFVRKLEKSGTRVIFSSVQPQIMDGLAAHRLGKPRISYAPSIEAALRRAEPSGPQDLGAPCQTAHRP
jgi:sulfate permease, SulP family